MKQQGNYRAFLGQRGWYIAWERADGFHHQPAHYAPIAPGDIEAQLKARKLELRALAELAQLQHARAVADHHELPRP